ncbi:unnamed protein product [Chondrus crispus]|uniref:Sugar phosphate transporter domain-containing protein n=1 Tax=Chondrus crispus TaxID=2769 RepID=R7Q986_CHOCR|nr:unnamed protein product [Chondrus crispus]CDF34614.1 unnamed protein product [Chondrus crispus]|eukprot:XP_005714433.1 unnamed protein product [Chondrus crispus]
MITAEQVTHSTTEAGATSLVTGICFVLVSCLFYSTNYVIAEHFLDSTRRDDEDDPSVLPPPSGLDLSLYTGGSCLLLFSIYISLHTIPNWELLVTSSIRRHHGNITIILEEYFYLAVASFFHAISHYDVVATIGAVPIGVCNAIRAVSVFGVSSLLFCTHQASQCYNSRKGLSTAIVIIGALGYSATSYRIPIAPSYTLLKHTEGNSRKAVKRVRRALSASAELSRSLASLSFAFLDGSDVKQSQSSRSPDHPE